ncbi:MAG: tetratricopeptide repeat protein [Gammaproteobacteria bacterium]
MDVYATDEEKVEAIRKWWTENGTTLITGVLLGLALLFGAKAWFAYQHKQSDQASNVYVQVMDALASNNSQAAMEAGEVLTTKYSSSAYAVLATMALAKFKLEQGQNKAAQAELQWALQHADQHGVKQIVRLRLARVMVAEKDYAGAAGMLDEMKEPGTFKAEYEEVRGDLAMARNKPDEARKAYEQALAALPPDAPERGLFQAKRDDAVRSQAAEPKS